MSTFSKMTGILGLVVIMGMRINVASGDCPSFPSGFVCKCNGDDTEWVCAKWGQGGTPTEGLDFLVTYVSGVPDVTLSTGDLGWELYSEVISSGAAADLGAVTISDSGSDDYEVTIKNGSGAGADDVGSIVLDDAGFAGYSNLGATTILGDVNGAITLVKQGTQGGTVTGNVQIHGDVTGLITIPKISAFLTIGLFPGSGNVSEGFEIEVLDSFLTIEGTLPANKTGEIGDIDSGNFTIDTVAEDATLDLLNGVPADATGTSTIRNLAGELDLHDKDLAGDLFLGDVAITGTVVNGGAVRGIHYPSWNGGNFAGTATFSSVEAGGQIYAFDGGPGDTTISGTIIVTGHYAGLFRTAGDFTGSLTIDGDLKVNHGEDGLIWIVEESSGDVHIKGDLIGHVHYPKTFATPGCLTVDGNVTSSGLFKTGDNLTGESHGGDLIFNSDVDGDILIHGNMAGDTTITGDLTGDFSVDADLSGNVTVGDALANAGAGGGRILITGETTGAVQVGEQTATLTLIHFAGGFDDPGTLEINTTRGNFTAGGDIVVGPAAYFTLPPVTFDGCMRIYDDNGPSPKGGSLQGDLTVNGCHATNHDLHICIDGDDNDNVTINQDGCANTVDWSCGTCPP